MLPPRPGKPLILYISATENEIGTMLAQVHDGVERAVYYLSRVMTDTEERYTPIEKLGLALYHACTKLRYYMLPVVVHVISQTDVVKYILTKPFLKSRLGKWALAFSEFALQYVPQKAVRGQALADFLASHPTINVEEATETIEIDRVEQSEWEMWFDGSRTNQGGRCRSADHFSGWNDH